MRLCDQIPRAAEGGHCTDGVLPSGLQYTLRSCDAKGKKGMVLYKDAGGNRALFVEKSSLSNHNETLLSLFGWSITASCTELFNLLSLFYDYEHNKDYGAFRAAVLMRPSAPSTRRKSRRT